MVCPLGCRLTVEREGKEFLIQGGCFRGKAYARQEATYPCRVVTTTICVRGGEIPRLPVRTSRPFPRDRIFELMSFLHSLEVEAPVTRGEVIVRNLLGEDIDLVATRTIRRPSEPQEDSRGV